MKKLFITLAALMCLGCGATMAKTVDGKQVTQVKEWSVNNGKKTLDQVTKYDNSGNKVEEIDYDKAGDQKGRVTYKYNAAGKCIEEQHFDKYNKLEKTEKIEYNASGKKSSVKTYLPNGKLKNEHQFEYITK